MNPNRILQGLALFEIVSHYAAWLTQYLLNSSGWPKTHRDPRASASRVLRLKVYATTPGPFSFFKTSSLSWQDGLASKGLWLNLIMSSIHSTQCGGRNQFACSYTHTK